VTESPGRTVSTAWVTGGASGIGRAVVDRLVAAGCAVGVIVAGAIAFILGDDAARITGEVLHVNGGSLMP
jgi:NAD(P)-dependent dehydrogenase (short-subunit alcohol dehydrogenase family)